MKHERWVRWNIRKQTATNYGTLLNPFVYFVVSSESSSGGTLLSGAESPLIYVKKKNVLSVRVQKTKEGYNTRNSKQNSDLLVA